MKRTITMIAAAMLGPALASPLAHADPSPRGSANAMGYYLALGDSLAAGYQPGVGDDRTGGYVGGVQAAIRATTPKTTLVNLSCSGERVVSMVSGGVCTYDKGTQLGQALHFLHAHGRYTRVVTIDIGANDVQRCVSRTTGTLDLPCVQTGLADIATDLPMVLGKLRSEAPGARIVVLNYYNPFLAAYLQGDAGQALARQSAGLQATLNAIIGQAAATNGAVVADIASTFRSTDWTPAAFPGWGTLPTNVGYVCSSTWMCLRGDIHANDAGYALMAQTVAERL